ncbi:hypothetical protein V7161_25580 [Neobacillus drentensis]|uniref:hypothetical protein n=1 Tax=Neobacillus drentensis TaxID=220684 RepID=UPI00300397D7
MTSANIIFQILFPFSQKFDLNGNLNISRCVLVPLKELILMNKWNSNSLMKQNLRFSFL